jgi:hemolysin III
VSPTVPAAAADAKDAPDVTPADKRRTPPRSRQTASPGGTQKASGRPWARGPDAGTVTGVPSPPVAPTTSLPDGLPGAGQADVTPPRHGLEAPDVPAEAGWAQRWAARPTLRGWLHAAALPVAAAGTGVLAARRRGKRAPIAAYGAGLCTMFGTSAAYHRLTRSERTYRWARSADHAAIFAAIAGTATPLVASVTTGRTRAAAIAGTWALAAAAAAERVAGIHQGRDRSYSHLAAGWLGVALLPALARRHGTPTAALFAAGGGAYTAGAALFAARWPGGDRRHYGYHEVWHTFTLAGAGFHLAAVATATRAA